MNSVYDLIIAEKEKFIFKLFRKHGYNRAKVMKLLERERISIVRQKNHEFYYVDDELVFEMAILTRTEQGSCKVTYSFKEVFHDETRLS